MCSEIKTVNCRRDWEDYKQQRRRKPHHTNSYGTGNHGGGVSSQHTDTDDKQRERMDVIAKGGVYYRDIVEFQLLLFTY